MEITKITRQNINDINKANQPFEVIGKIIPKLTDGKWSYTEKLYDQSYIKKYSNDSCDYAAYIDNVDSVVFFAYDKTECIGQVILKKKWNLYAFIEDICVAQSVRGQGVGTALMQKAIEWAKDSDLQGLALETQDNNLLACRFYAKCGFSIGGVDTLLYKNLVNEETAVFWYLKFNE